MSSTFYLLTIFTFILKRKKITKFFIYFSFMDVHEEGMLINEMYDMLSEEEFQELSNQWRKRYEEEYLMGKMKKFLTPKI